VAVSFQDIRNGFDFVDIGGGLHRAILCRRTGKIYQHAEAFDLEEFNDELPDDVEDEEKYIDIPGKRELGLGKPWRWILRMNSCRTISMTSETCSAGAAPTGNSAPW